jgi:hypothetical protein
VKEALRFAETGRKKCPQLVSRPLTKSTAPTHDGTAAHGTPYIGDQCGQDRLRRRHRWIVRRGPGCPGLRLPMRSGWPINDTATCSVVSRSRFCSAGRWVARARPCQQRRWPTAAGCAASPGPTAIRAARRRRGRNTVVWSARIPQGDLARIPQRRPERSPLRTRPDGSRTAAATGRSPATATFGSVDACGPIERKPALVQESLGHNRFRDPRPPLSAKPVARDQRICKPPNFAVLT